jgi:hypothetical protein
MNRVTGYSHDYGDTHAVGQQMRRLTLAVAMCALALPAAANFRAINWLVVVPITAETFEVLESRGAGAADIWCAAADYARRAGLDGPRKRMYIDVPRGPSQTTPNGIGVGFTLNPGPEIADTPASYSVSVKRRGENLAIGHAYDFCQDLLFDGLRGF